MRFFRRSFLFFFLPFFFLPKNLFADFKLLDAIQEFGEKRFVQTTPARLRVGPVKFHPTLRTKAEYDSNILLERRDAKRDVVFNIQPGTIIELPIDKHQLAVGYEADFEIFSKPRDSNQNAQNQNFFALADLRFPSWYVNVLENLKSTTDRSGTTFTARIPRIDQSVNPKIGYRWKRTIFELGYRNFVRDFKRHVDKPLDFNLNEWTGVIYYDLFARLKLLLEYQIAQIEYPSDRTRAGLFNQVRAGFEGEVIPNLLLKLRAGPQFRNYYRSSEKDFDSWVAKFSADYKIRKNFRVKAYAGREAVEATFAGVNFYKLHELGFETEYDLLPQWTLFAGSGFARHSYAERATVNDRSGFRRDHLIFAKTGVRYHFREWMEFELAYEYWHRTSNFSTFSYNDHRVSLSSNLHY